MAALISFGLMMSFVSHSQEITKVADPYLHTTRIFVGQVKIKPTVFVSFRTTGKMIYLYIEGWREAVGMVNSDDPAIFITEKDSVIIHPTGIQDYHDRGKGDYRHEYVLSETDLVKLSESALKRIVRYTTSGVSEIAIPEKSEKILMASSSKLLHEWGAAINKPD